MFLVAAALATALNLSAVLDGVLAAPTLQGAHVGALVESTAGETLYEHGADDTIQPASTMKLLVGSVALDRLGPAHRFTTLLAHGDGNELVLYGGGDPLLRRADLDAAADAVVKAGIAQASVTIDESQVDPNERKAPGWELDDVLAYYAPVVNALPFEENVLPVTLVPAAVLGLPPAVQLPAPFVPQTVPAGMCVPGPTLLTFTVNALTVPAGQPDTSDVTPGPCGDIVVTGNVPMGGPSHVDAAVDQPEVLARRYFEDALRRRGVEVLPAPPARSPIPGAVVWEHDGEPLTALLGDMWLPSDNLIAEELLRNIDLVVNHHAGSLEGGAAVERAWLQSIGVDPATLTIADGSGLSQYDRVTPRALVAILQHDWHGPNRATVLAALPVPGVRGDLRNAMLGTPAVGHVFAKTGSMSHVRGLAGYVTTRTHGTLVFALEIDDWRGTDADLAPVRAAFCSQLAEW